MSDTKTPNTNAPVDGHVTPGSPGAKGVNQDEKGPANKGAHEAGKEAGNTAAGQPPAGGSHGPHGK